MSDPTVPSDPVDPDDQLAAISEELVVALGAALPGWLDRTLRAMLDTAGVHLDMGSETELRALCAELANRIHDDVAAVVRADPDAGRGTPLDVIRRSLGPANDFLAERGVRAPERDAFDRRWAPDDSYGLAPANFSVIDPAVHEPAIAWGAARAYVHLDRRRADAARSEQ